MPAAIADRKNFILFTAPIFQAIEKEFFIPTRIALIQSAHESNWGISALAIQGKNIFSLTPGQMWVDCHVYNRDLSHLPAWSKAEDGHPVCYFETTEYSKSPPQKILYWEIPGDVLKKDSDGAGGALCTVRRYFRKYESWEESAEDWATKLSTEARYAQAYLAATKNDIPGFAVAIGKSGFATDPNYGKLLLGVNDAIDQIQEPS